MTTLHLSPDLKLPLDTVTSTLVVYGGKGMGKTNLGSVVMEELAAHGLKFSVIDPMGVWWGPPVSTASMGTTSRRRQRKWRQPWRISTSGRCPCSDMRRCYGRSAWAP